MVGLAWYAPLGGALILGSFVFVLARVQQRRFVRRYERWPESASVAAKATHRPA